MKVSHKLPHSDEKETKTQGCGYSCWGFCLDFGDL